MVAGDTKRIVVIRNISSNLIEEAILILRNETGTHRRNFRGKVVHGTADVNNDFILREAEGIINRYIKEKGLTTAKNNRHFGNNNSGGRKILRISISVNALINVLLVTAIAFLLWVSVKLL